MAEIVNLQQSTDIDLETLQTFCSQLRIEVAEADACTFDVALIDDERMKQLNQTFRGKGTTTDVLSFPFEGEPFEMRPADDGSAFLGDIVISLEQAGKQAAENGMTLENEVKQLILHGLLHLCGLDHETDDGQMDQRELELRGRIGI